jgi:hypothetical protein
MKNKMPEKSGWNKKLRPHNSHSTWRRFGWHDKTLRVYSGTEFRYGLEFRCTPEYNGTGFRYFDLSG